MKKIIASFLILVLCLNCCFINVKAALLSGEGTKENPYVISTADDLNDVRNYLNAYFILNNDIDLSEYLDFLPIGNSVNAFNGYFNGNGKKITGLTMNFEGYAYDEYIEKEPSTDDDDDDGYTTGGDSGWTGDYEIGGKPDNDNDTETVIKIPKYIGLFGVNNGEIYDLHIEDVNITACALNEEVYVGAICGLNKGQIYRSYSTVSTLNSNAETDYCGGIAGKNINGGTIGNCFSNVTVSANIYAGGLAGQNTGYVACSYYNGFDVTAENADAICNNSGTVQYNYYLKSLLTSTHATMLTAGSFFYSSYFAGFNFNTVWQMNNTLKQPELKNNPYPVKSTGDTALTPEISSVVGKTVTLVTDGNTLFSTDGVCWTKNNVFTQEYGVTVSYYAKKAETTANYIGAVSNALEFTNKKSYDINGDGAENSKDLTIFRRYLADWDVIVVSRNLDTNDDGLVNSKDATYLARYFADWYN